MLSILGIGCSYPKYRITNDFIAEISPHAALDHDALAAIDLTGVRARFSVLSPEYIKSTGNVDPSRAFDAQSPFGKFESPTELGARAARIAVEKAGLDISQIGLVIADCSTPDETTPAEAQRIANKLGLKIPAFDTVSNSTSMPMFFDILSSWKEEKMPDYALCVSVHTPSSRINYQAGAERIIFGDAASAVVVSTRKNGKFRVAESFLQPRSGALSKAKIEQYGKLCCALSVIKEDLLLSSQKLLPRAIAQAQQYSKDLVFLGPQISAPWLKKVAAEHGFMESNQIVNVEEVGDCLGASSFCALASSSDIMGPGKAIVALQLGIGGNIGYSVLLTD